MNRRQTFKLAAGAAAMAVSGSLLGRTAALAQAADGPFKLPPLGYAYDALEPISTPRPWASITRIIIRPTSTPSMA